MWWALCVRWSWVWARSSSSPRRWSCWGTRNLKDRARGIAATLTATWGSSTSWHCSGNGAAPEAATSTAAALGSRTSWRSLVTGALASPLPALALLVCSCGTGSSDGGVRAEAVRNVGDATTSAVDLHPAYRFMMEAQLEALEDVFNQISERHPERFREVERGRVLIENLEILLNGTQPDGCGPAGA